jgi:hypothetical protein
MGSWPLVTLRGAYALLLEDDREARVAISDLLEDWGDIVSSGPSMETLKSSHDGSDRIGSNINIFDGLISVIFY